MGDEMNYYVDLSIATSLPFCQCGVKVQIWENNDVGIT